jgi:DNA-binding HxlR family transcriptional regulator
MEDPKGYGQYCPIARAVEVLGERWSVLIIRDLLCGFTRFNDLARANPSLSRTLLAKRLRQLERACLLEHIDDEYLLTPAGHELKPIVFAIGGWAARWMFDEPRETELDPLMLMWWVHRRLDFSQLPDRRLVLEFRFPDHPDRFWILRDMQGPSVCTFDPGFGVDATVECGLSTLFQVWLGKIGLPVALRDGRLVITGPPTIVRRMPSVLALSPMAPFVIKAQSA